MLFIDLLRWTDFTQIMKVKSPSQVKLFVLFIYSGGWSSLPMLIIIRIAVESCELFDHSRHTHTHRSWSCPTLSWRPASLAVTITCQKNRSRLPQTILVIRFRFSSRFSPLLLQHHRLPSREFPFNEMKWKMDSTSTLCVQPLIVWFDSKEQLLLDNGSNANLDCLPLHRYLPSENCYDHMYSEELRQFIDEFLKYEH